MTSLPKVQVSNSSSIHVDLRCESDLNMCAMSLIHTHAPKTTLEYAKMIYSIQNKKLQPMKKHGHIYITPSWRVRPEYKTSPSTPLKGDPGTRIRKILLELLSPAAHLCVLILLSNPDLLVDAA